jgi:hypothetical protein
MTVPLLILLAVCAFVLLWDVLPGSDDDHTDFPDGFR